jgi:hypothetical protein
MRRKRFSICLAAIVILAGLVCLILLPVLGHQSAPLTIQFASRIGSWNGDGPFPPGARFLLTNNTSKTLVVSLDRIEARTAYKWAVHSALSSSPFTLAPHAGVYANIEPGKWPPGSWRITASAADELTGANRARAAISRLANCWARGRSCPENPFSKYAHYYGAGSEIPSQEVPAAD